MFFKKKIKKNYKRFKKKNVLFKNKKFCRFTALGIKNINYKNIDILKNLIQENGKISSKRITGTKSKMQRQVNKAIKIGRYIAFFSYICSNIK